MSDPPQVPYGGAGDSRAGDLSLADRFRRHADSLLRSRRSPLYQELMRAPAEDIDGEHRLGDPGSPLRFVEPWAPPPPIDLGAAARALRVVERAGCDVAPLDPSRPEDQLTLLSYIWPDELDRLKRLRAALSVAARDPVRIAAQRASEWLTHVLGAGDEDALTVVWHSVMRQYVEPEEWAAIERALHEHPAVVRLSMEPSLDDHLGLQQLAFRAHPGDAEIVLARVGDHGLPIRWDTYSPAA